MSELLIKSRIDFAFKEIMMDEQALIGFLSAMLRLNPADIRGSAGAECGPDERYWFREHHFRIIAVDETMEMEEMVLF